MTAHDPAGATATALHHPPPLPRHVLRSPQPTDSAVTAALIAVLAAAVVAGIYFSFRAESRRIDNHIAKFLREEHLDD